MQLPRNVVNYSVSHGTLNLKHLRAAFDEFLERYDIPLPEYTEEEWEESPTEIISEDYFPLLDEVAPDGTYFGTHPGDGSDFGFWELEEYFNDEPVRQSFVLNEDLQIADTIIPEGTEIEVTHGRGGRGQCGGERQFDGKGRRYR